MDNPGKSGAKFYQSYDRLFVIKTLTSEEVERMHSFLKQYHPVSDSQNIILINFFLFYFFTYLMTYFYFSILLKDMEKHYFLNIWVCIG
jgi:hypothetical protein